VHGEFLEMPGLTLSIAQAARLFSLPPAVCARVFGELLNSQLLRRTADGRYVLLRRHS
jgi:DNA-binding IclR family transcriptional regulator